MHALLKHEGICMHGMHALSHTYACMACIQIRMPHIWQIWDIILVLHTIAVGPRGITHGLLIDCFLIALFRRLRASSGPRCSQRAQLAKREEANRGARSANSSTAHSRTNISNQKIIALYIRVWMRWQLQRTGYNLYFHGQSNQVFETIYHTRGRNRDVQKLDRTALHP